MKNLFSIMSDLQTHDHLKFDFKKVDQHTGGKCLIHGPKPRKDNQSKTWNSPAEYPSQESNHGMKVSGDTMFNIQGNKCPGAVTSRDKDYLVTESLDV